MPRVYGPDPHPLIAEAGYRLATGKLTDAIKAEAKRLAKEISIEDPYTSAAETVRKSKAETKRPATPDLSVHVIEAALADAVATSAREDVARRALAVAMLTTPIGVSATSTGLGLLIGSTRQGVLKRFALLRDNVAGREKRTAAEEMAAAQTELDKRTKK